MSSSRFVGTFVHVVPAYGFITNVQLHFGNANDIPKGDVFLRVSALPKGDRRRHTLQQMDKQRLFFDLRPSEMHLGKVEACGIRQVEHQYLPF